MLTILKRGEGEVFPHEISSPEWPAWGTLHGIIAVEVDDLLMFDDSVYDE